MRFGSGSAQRRDAVIAAKYTGALPARRNRDLGIPAPVYDLGIKTVVYVIGGSGQAHNLRDASRAPSTIAASLR